MADFVFALNALAAVLLLFVACYVFRDYVVNSPLDKLPGPPPASFLLGE